jgi:hypothetical protein
MLRLLACGAAAIAAIFTFAAQPVLAASAAKEISSYNKITVRFTKNAKKCGFESLKPFERSLREDLAATRRFSAKDLPVPGPAIALSGLSSVAAMSRAVPIIPSSQAIVSSPDSDLPLLQVWEPRKQFQVVKNDLWLALKTRVFVGCRYR